MMGTQVKGLFYLMSKPFLILPVRESPSLFCHHDLALIQPDSLISLPSFIFKTEPKIYLYIKIILQFYFKYHFNTLMKYKQYQKKIGWLFQAILRLISKGKIQLIKPSLMLFNTKANTDLFIFDIKNLIICLPKESTYSFYTDYTVKNNNISVY